MPQGQLERYQNDVSYGSRALRYARVAGRVARFAQHVYNRRRNQQLPAYTARRTSHVTRGSNRSAVIAGSNYIGTATGRHKRKMKAKRTYTKPITKEFRKKVKKIMENDEVTGKYRKTIVGHLWYGNETYPRNVAPPNGTYENKQRVEYLPVASIFDLFGVMNTAGVLWKSKVPPPLGANTIDTAKDFSSKTAKIHAKNLTCKINFTNNSQRVYNIKLYTIAPKHEDDNIEPRGEWDVLTTTMGVTTSDTAGNANVTGTSIYEIGSSPTIYKAWMHNFKYEIKKIRLMPGQTYSHFIQGPQDITYDYAKHWDGNTFNARSKPERWLMVQYHADLLATDSYIADGDQPGNVGFPVEVNPTPNHGALFDGKGVLVEMIQSWHLGMPEQTGFVYPVSTAAGVTQDNLFRRESFGLNNYYEAIIGQVVRTDNEAPDNPYDPSETN